ncbi:MAG: rRNA maturation RNase YbeY [Chloroflexi bacterium]|nr:rRNA maturation RNase YbeY [Chloroflexota bacterium]|tara:strand:+ start:10896 stop:11345 length:450 start_codon:yes stop_codon:yes gene_type:complete
MKKNITVQCKNISKVPLTKKNIETLIEDLLDKLNVKTLKINLIFCTDRELKDLNAEFRNKNEVTDILTFPNSDDFPHGLKIKEKIKINGDIFIARDHSLKKAVIKKISHTLELKHLIIHGVLHLLNYDHKETDDDFLEIEESILGNKIH